VRSKIIAAAIALLGVWRPGLTQESSARFRAAALPEGAVWVDSLDLSKAAVRRPRPARGQPAAPVTPLVPISLAGEPYSHGLPLLVNADLAIELDGHARRFEAMVGIDDDRKAGQGSATFEVWVDGKKTADSGVLKSGAPPKLVSVDLTGAKRMILSVGDAGDGPRDDAADWGGAMIVMAAQGAELPRVVGLPADPSPALASIRARQPSINEPRIVGTTPGRPFLFRVPASGAGPLTFGSKNLPAGLSLNAQTGIISGALAAAGTTVVGLTVSAAAGTASADLTIVGGEHMLARTPPLGWNSWNVWGGTVDDAKVRAAADGLVASGLAGEGYRYVNIDDAWEGPRDVNGEITSNEKFPDIKALADYVHAKGLQIGIYSSPGPRTCQQRYAGSYQHEAQDARTWAKWGFDYIKYDWCSYSDVEPAAARAPRPALEKPYSLMRGILDTLNRDMVFSLCQYGWGDVWECGAEVGGNAWRVTGDITDTWPSMTCIGFAQTGHEKFAGPGHWNDTDMLVVGKVGWGRELRDTHLTPNEQITHITLWSLQAAPLIIGADLSQIDPFTTDLLGNPEVLAVNQDPLGRAAGRTRGDGRTEVWASRLADGTTAVGLFNRNPEPVTVRVNWSELGISGRQPVRDLWRRQDLAPAADAFEAVVPRHGAVLVRIGKSG